ncbi:MAG TPA: S8 family serine peptidase [Polyangiaceae bacterium]|nr:S8 family serine peptidase [Polyangiaceae bacterium]
MKIDRAWFEELIFRGAAARRFTQDSPILPDVWIEYAQAYPVDAGPIELLLTPHRAASAGQLAQAVRERLRAEREAKIKKKDAISIRDAGVAHHMSGVCANLTFQELVRVVMPLSSWWHDTFKGSSDEWFTPAARQELLSELRRTSPDTEEREPKRKASAPKLVITPDLLWTIRIVGTILLARGAQGSDAKAFNELSQSHAALLDAFAGLMKNVVVNEGPALLWTVSRNRKVKLAIERSRQAVKVDAAQRLFQIDTRNLAWAVLDTGIDARHPAFQRRKTRTRQGSSSREGLASSRVLATFDFTHVRDLLNPDVEERPRAAASQRAAQAKGAKTKSAPRRKSARARNVAAEDSDSAEQRATDLTRRLQRGRSVDWGELREFLEVPHDEDDYPVPSSEHGTHVAGILAANWEVSDEADSPPESLVGMCPDLNVYDFRVFDANGEGDEFMVMAALQFVRHLNAEREQPLIHGINLSVSLAHDVANYACGRTPICEECERVVSSGVVVVAAAGNEGYMRFVTPQGDTEGYRSISISDPGNAASVITVGATHRHQPHTYGVSYFSSRGPTGDGRQKPDLVAPGEKITAPIPDRKWGTKDGTSMAAPHVSGAAALLMARHRELLGQPQRVKEILCSTATDLGRERYFQGSGMVDVLRAIQAV